MADMSQDQFNKMMKMMESFLKGTGGSANDAQLRKMYNDMRKKEHKIIERNIDAMEEQGEVIESSIKAADRAFRSFNNAIYSSGEAAEQFTKIYKKSNVGLKKQSSVLSGLLETRLQNDKFDEFSEKVLASANNLNFLNKSLGKKVIINSINELDAAQTLAASSANAMKKAMEDSGGDLSRVFQELSKKIASNEALSEAERNLYQIGVNNNLLNANNDQIKEYINGVEKEIKVLSKSVYWEQMKIKAMMDVKDKLGVFGKALGFGVGPIAALTASLGLLTQGVIGAWQQMTLIGQSGMYAQWDQIKMAQARLGVSFENAVKIFQENTRTMSYLGGSKFLSTINNAQDELMRFGLDVDQSAQAAADFTKNTALAGIDIKDSDKLKKSIEMQTQAFGKLRATTGISIEEFKAFTSEMVSNNDIQSTLNGLNQVDRMNKMKDMMDLRQKFTNLGMSAQTAQKAMVAMQELGKQKVVDRFSQAAKLKQAMLMSGVGNADQLSNIFLKGQRASKQEQAMLMEGIQGLTKNLDEQSLGSYVGEHLANVMQEQVSFIQNLSQASREASLAGEGQGKLNENQAKMLAEQSKVPVLLSKTNEMLSTILNNFRDPVFKLAAGVAGILASLLALRIATSAGSTKVATAVKSSGSQQIQAEAIETGKVVNSVNKVEHAVINSAQSVGDVMEGGPSGKRNRKTKGGKKGGRRGGKGSAIMAAASSVTGSSGCCNEMGNIANTLGDVAEDLAADKIGEQVAKKTGKWAAAKSMMGKGIGAAGRFIGSAASLGVRASGIGSAGYGIYEGAGLLKDAYEDVQARKRGETPEQTWKNDWGTFWKEAKELPGEVGDAIMGTAANVSDKVTELMAEGKTLEQAKNIATNTISTFGDLATHSAAGIISEMAGLASAEPVNKTNSVINPQTETQQDISRAKEEEKTSSVDVKTPKTEAEYLKDMGAYLTELKNINTESNNLNQLQVEVLSALVKTNKEADEYLRSKMTGNLNGFGPKTENSYINFLTRR